MQSTASYPGGDNATSEHGPPILALLPSPEDRQFLSLAMTLCGRSGGRVAAWSLPDKAVALRQRLRSTALGIPGGGAASRALVYMVEASARGHHVPVRILAAQRAARAGQLDELGQWPQDSLLVTGWSRGARPPSGPSFRETLDAHPGVVLCMMECPSRPFSSALLVSFGKEVEAPAALTIIERELDRGYPCWRRQAADLPALEKLLSKTTASDLVLVSSPATQRADLGPLLDRLRHAGYDSSVGVLLPDRRSREAFLRWLSSA